MSTQLKFFALDSTGQPKLTQSGSKAATIIRQLNQAIIDNKDYSFGWFKGLNVETTDANAYEFADELREYAKFNAKKSIWDNTLATGNYFKWDYYAQESRATASLNIVDTEFINDRAFQIKSSEQNGDSNFIEYYGRYQPELFEISDVYYTTTQLQTFQDAGQQPPIPPAPYDTLNREHVLAWFKGVNLAPTTAALDRYRERIKNYLTDPRVQPDIKIDVGIFISK
jgi:hypothetical protein